VLLVGAMAAVLALAFALGAVARGIGTRSAAQRAADIGALAGARAMHDAYPRLFDGAGHALAKARYLSLGREAAMRAARLSGAGRVEVAFPDAETIAPVRIRVTVRERFELGSHGTGLHATAEAELVPTGADGMPAFATGGGYDGQLAYRQGTPMRPDVARAFDRLAAAARGDGVDVLVSSGFRSDAEQAVLWARNPDPRWVAPPGRSLHRYGTELDLGPPAAYAWLRANARRFHFVQRYSWEPWHFGFVLNARSAPRAPAAEGSATAGAGVPGRPTGGDGRASGGAVPGFVPARYARPIARAAQRHNVSATLLAAQIHAESGFNPFARSTAGAQGIAQFMPATARAYGLADPYDAGSAIDAQARMMRDLLRQFASVPLALAAYNAGPARVAACFCIPPISETRGYVARILGLMGGAGDASPASSLAVRLVG